MSFGHSLEFIRRRYNRLAAIYPVFELLLWLPWGIRARAVERLGLKPGDLVLEVGCGTGRNLPYLVNAVGPEGRVYGVDYSDGMLARARALCQRRGWKNVTLLQQDACELELPEHVQAALFSLSYAVMPEPRGALERAWRYVREGGTVVILDAKLLPGLLGKLQRPFILLMMKATVLGDPDVRSWDDLRELTPHFQMEEVNLGTYYICRGTKPSGAEALTSGRR